MLWFARERDRVEELSWECVVIGRVGNGGRRLVILVAFFIGVLFLTGAHVSMLLLTS